MRVSAAGAGTLLDEVERLLARALVARSRYLRLADRAARLSAPVVHVTAAVTLAGWLVAGASRHNSIIAAIAVLIITCPCALALAIPAVQVVACGALFREGVILGAGDAIERLAQVDTIVFDKTGTLTLPDVDPDMLEKAARLALSSRHPLAAALAHEAHDRTPCEGAVEEPGQGVRAMIDGTEARLGSRACCSIAQGQPSELAPGTSMIAFTHAGRSAVFALRQELRDDAALVAKSLAERGFALCILSGDRPAAVAPVAAALGISQWRGGLSPVQKIAAIDALNATGHRVLMVGDGLNDAPSLAAADVSLSADQRRPHHSGAGGCGVSRRAARAGAGGPRHRTPGPSAHAAESVTCGDLQRHRRADRHCRLCHSADCGRGDVRFLDPGHAQRISCTPSRQGRSAGAGEPCRRRYAAHTAAMNVLIYLVPMALMLGLTGLAAFLWSLRSGQYDDVEAAAVRILVDDDIDPDA